MDAHRLTASSGAEFEIIVGEDGRIADITGPWPQDGSEFAFEGPLPTHTRVNKTPAHIDAAAAKRGMDVCFYDPDGCRTCYCDDRDECIALVCAESRAIRNNEDARRQRYGPHRVSRAAGGSACAGGTH